MIPNWSILTIVGVNVEIANTNLISTQYNNKKIVHHIK